MASITIEDECLAPEKYSYVKYKGPDPWALAEAIEGSIRLFFHVSSSGFCNTRLNWDLSGNPILFYANWWVKKPVSKYTYLWYYIWIQGQKDKATGEGEFTLRLNGEVKTSFSGWGIFLKPVWYLYSYLVYDNLRQKQLQRCRATIEQFRTMIKERFNIAATQAPAVGGTYG